MTDNDPRALARPDDLSAFEAVMRQHNRMLYRLARSILKDDTEAEDALQEAYLAAYRNLPGFRGDSRMSSWLARIVINESYARLRKRKSAIVVPLSGEAPDVETSMPDRESGRPDAMALRAELRALLTRKIDALPEQFRTVFVMRDVEDLSVEETAECLAIPEATVRSRAFRARALLRESIAREIDIATVDAFGFDGERCDRIVASVLGRISRSPQPPQETS